MIQECHAEALALMDDNMDRLHHYWSELLESIHAQLGTSEEQDDDAGETMAQSLVRLSSQIGSMSVDADHLEAELQLLRNSNIESVRNKIVDSLDRIIRLEEDVVELTRLQAGLAEENRRLAEISQKLDCVKGKQTPDLISRYYFSIMTAFARNVMDAKDSFETMARTATEAFNIIKESATQSFNTISNDATEAFNLASEHATDSFKSTEEASKRRSKR